MANDDIANDSNVYGAFCGGHIKVKAQFYQNVNYILYVWDCIYYICFHCRVETYATSNHALFTRFFFLL